MDNKLHFAEISGAKICREDGSAVVLEWVKCGIDSLRTRRSYLFRPPLSCKLGVIFFDTSVDLDLYGGDHEDEKMLRFFETVLRMLLKACAHALWDEENRLIVKGIVTDGEPWHRALDEVRILGPLMLEAREYVEIDRDAYIEGLVSDHTSSECSDKDKAQLLQLTDLLLGSVIHCCFRDLRHNDKKEKIVRPAREMLGKRKRGRSFKWSGHYKSFTLSFGSTKAGEWNFEQVGTKEVVFEDNQLRLF